MGASPQQLQHDFYTATAERYDRQHIRDNDEHAVALAYMSMLISGLELSSVLDVGAGTGRGVRHFLNRHPGVAVRGVEPVRAMIDIAERVHGVPAGCIEQGVGDPLPFASGSFDAVCELGVLHHVPNPNEIVREMTRVARRAVLLSDANRFGQGTRAACLAKYALHRLGLWSTVCRLRTRGHGYHLSGDGGVAYSYSVYDSLAMLQAWADRVFLVPTLPARADRFHPLFGAPHILLCAIREG